MKIKIRSDSVEIEGYVNAIERASKPLMSRIGRFIERICTGAFKKALKRADDVHILLNHDWNRDLGSIKRGNLELEEDNIGLHAKATITDPEVVEDARRGNLVGWSFGFQDRDVENSVEDGLPLRKVRDLDLFEVSLLNRKMTPAYNGTLVTARSADGEEVESYLFRGEPLVDENVEKVDIEDEDVNENAADTLKEEAEAEDEKNLATRDEDKSQESEEPLVEKTVEKTGKIDYTRYKDIIKDMKEEIINV